MVATLDALIHEVRDASDDPLLQLERAVNRASEMGELADALLTYFVDRCRRSGLTWAEIGAHLGVTRQAAQRRFVDSVGDGVTFERFTMRAREALDAATAAAESLRHNYVGTEHELLGLFDVPGALAARVLNDAGVRREDVERSVLAHVQPGEVPTSGPLPFTPKAKKVLEEAANSALDLGHNYVGTEHILLGLYRGQEGVALQVLEELGATREAVRAGVIKALSGFSS
jgi:Clp amino terminal domain, pathogenicity island component